ncbi:MULTISPECIES: type I DNA topoisomerase [Bifidobacterium]|uniref:type I DNA topoisomerase n=1 Tax=Bifidobacterium TaxID=1678 RepID=UPI00101EA698|nr:MULTISPECIES: type I DNA topoisomerase [Bifidobacterium]MBQ1600532.1 type I DNA topoisomerase [Bifidobacterium sp.]NLW58154.1 type I DNA topoisomerase [Bifidobacterium pseudolongum subsp. globosum]RYQ03715.1 DNA topoisomerase I [Bifidobacterium pseudolongum subsp. globosum]RYQ64116.1 DNA topoisomerase I [Bifidobacterium pseudolongum subsp. globosum]
MTTGSKLVIVESPAKAKKIGGYLGEGYTVLASVGHIRDLAQPSQIPADQKAQYGKFGVDVNDGFKPYYIVGADKKKTVSELRSALKHASELYLATDEDREGEAIAWHLVQTLKPKVPVKRMVFHEITPEAIRASLEHTRQVDDHMVDAQETRRILDRLYGYELSPVLWRKVGPGLSAGRVQSVATRLIVERERERMAFVRAPYWDVVAQLQAPDALGELTGFDARLTTLDGRRVAGSKDFTAAGTLTDAAAHDDVRQLTEADATALADTLRDADFLVSSVEKKPYRRRPQPPFTTSTMQQAAGNRLGMSSRQTMRAAQSLYENGYITYMRTDSVTLSHEAIAAARESVAQQFGEQYLAPQPKQYATKTAGAQEAHECIRPAGSRFRAPDELASTLPPDQLKLYTLIWQRTLASQMADATGFTAVARFTAPSPDFGEAVFQASGTVIEFPGFLRVLGSARAKASDEASLPPMSEGQVLTATGVQADGHETQPPARYTEASLVKTLEAKEIGRPSTYASIISTIMDRGYVYERGRALIPSWLAFAVTKLLETRFPTYVDYQFTADMENGLDQIAHGKETGREWLTAFYFGTGRDAAHTAHDVHEGLQQQVAQLGEIDARAINTIEIGDGLAVRVGRYGPYLEDCAHLDAEGNPKRATIPDTLAPDELTVAEARKLIDSNAGGPRVLGTDPATGGTVEVRNGRYGPYVALVLPGQEQAAHEHDAKKSKKAEGERPKMASLFKSMSPETVTLADALRLLSLPREVYAADETNAKTGEIEHVTVSANNGRYGPYLTRAVEGGASETRSLENEDAIFTVTEQQARDLFAQPKYGRGRGRAAKPPLRELGNDPATNKPVTIKEGFYGAYITDGETNRSLPKQYDPKTISAEDAFRLLAEKRAAGPTKRRGRKSATKAKAKAKSTATSTGSAQKAREERRRKVRELADKGWANSRIAKELGTTAATVKSDVEYMTEHDGYSRPPVVPNR